MQIIVNVTTVLNQYQILLSVKYEKQATLPERGAYQVPEMTHLSLLQVNVCMCHLKRKWNCSCGYQNQASFA